MAYRSEGAISANPGVRVDDVATLRLRASARTCRRSTSRRCRFSARRWALLLLLGSWAVNTGSVSAPKAVGCLSLIIERDLEGLLRGCLDTEFAEEFDPGMVLHPVNPLFECVLCHRRTTDESPYVSVVYGGAFCENCGEKFAGDQHRDQYIEHTRSDPNWRELEVEQAAWDLIKRGLVPCSSCGSKSIDDVALVFTKGQVEEACFCGCKSCATYYRAFRYAPETGVSIVDWYLLQHGSKEN